VSIYLFPRGKHPYLAVAYTCSFLNSILNLVPWNGVLTHFYQDLETKSPCKNQNFLTWKTGTVLITDCTPSSCPPRCFGNNGWPENLGSWSSCHYHPIQIVQWMEEQSCVTFVLFFTSDGTILASLFQHNWMFPLQHYSCLEWLIQ